MEIEGWLQDVAEVRLIAEVDGARPVSLSFEDGVELLRAAFWRERSALVMGAHGVVVFMNPLHVRLEVDVESVPAGVDAETAHRRVIDAVHALHAASQRALSDG